MTDKVCRFTLGTENRSVRVVVSLVFNESATEEEVVQIMTETMLHGMERFLNGPYEEPGRPGRNS